MKSLNEHKMLRNRNKNMGEANISNMLLLLFVIRRLSLCTFQYEFYINDKHVEFAWNLNIHFTRISHNIEDRKGEIKVKQSSRAFQC